MNTMPDNELLTLWLEGELEGPDLVAVDAWIADHPEWLERRASIQSWQTSLRAVLPREEELPAAEFFQARLAKAIREESPATAAKPAEVAAVVAGKVTAVRSWWARLALPAAALIGMGFCFWAGTAVNRTGSTQAVTTQPDKPTEGPWRPSLYTPQQGVKASIVDSEHSGASVIVLEGVAAIPDSFEVPTATADTGVESEKERVTAGTSATGEANH